MSLPLEDFFNDVIGKAQRGLRLDDETLAAKASVSLEDLHAAKNGTVDPAVLTHLAGALNLHGPSLIVMAGQSWRPADVTLDGLAQINTTWEDMTVNAYLVWDPKTKLAAAFDTGANAQPMLDFIHDHGLTLALVFLTHTHPDHIADLHKLSAASPHAVFINEREPVSGAQTFAVDRSPSWQLGGLTIEPRNTHGHSKGGTTYVITGLAQPVAVVGDALFASSMGGGMVSFADALATNRREIFSLPDDTVVCPGHGPLTTVGEEKAHNPFYPEFK
jgi:glyoxylase-like metal-dependent hydrolase (beta-lactamase superfamily II)